MRLRLMIFLLICVPSTGCSDGNVKIDYSRIVEQSDELRLAGRCTAQALPPNHDTHICGMTAAYAYTVRTTLRNKSTGRVETKISFMNKCEEHYMDPDKIERDMRRTWGAVRQNSLVEMVSIEVAVKPLD